MSSFTVNSTSDVDLSSIYNHPIWNAFDILDENNETFVPTDLPMELPTELPDLRKIDPYRQACLLISVGEVACRLIWATCAMMFSVSLFMVMLVTARIMRSCYFRHFGPSRGNPSPVVMVTMGNDNNGGLENPGFNDAGGDQDEEGGGGHQQQGPQPENNGQQQGILQQ